MTNNPKRKAAWPIFIIFILSNALILTARRWAKNYNIDTDILMIGNVVLLVATLVSFVLYERSLKNNQPQAFLRYIYSGMFLKMLICLFAAFIYIAISGTVNKPALFGCMFLYFVYTFVEVSILLRLSKQQKNVQTGSPS
jgi:FtsH-binding integral membrane protein